MIMPLLNSNAALQNCLPDTTPMPDTTSSTTLNPDTLTIPDPAPLTTSGLPPTDPGGDGRPPL